ncbi:MAG: hypothetical protein NXI31_00825 [bacterium]|nr:hypothetical protein [bacterium]
MNRVVYDSEHGRTMCPRCDRPVPRCRCEVPSDQADEGDGVVRVRREVRRGKPVTVIAGLQQAESELRALAKALKKKCSTGGSAKDGQIEIQGDHRELLVRELEARNYRVKLAGG